MSEPARIDKELVVLVGRNRENPRTHREAFEITGGLGEMLDKHIKRNNLNKSEFIREAVAAKLEAEMPKEPLIKDEKVRKAVRAWAEANDINHSHYYENDVVFDSVEHCLTWIDTSIQFNEIAGLENLKHGKKYTIAELCGEEDCKPDTREKLKAWKRLEDKGFRFKGVEVFSKGLLEIDAVLPAIANADDAERLKMLDDLELLFPEEEEE